MEKVIVAVITALFCAMFGSKDQKESEEKEEIKAKVSTFEVEIKEIDRPAVEYSSRA